jgi:hypothetical protein
MKKQTTAGPPHALKTFLNALTDIYEDAAVEDSHLLPVLIIQRQRIKKRDMWHQWVTSCDYETVDTPHYIWVEKGSSLTPEMLYQRALGTIRNSLDSDKRREALSEEVTDKFACQTYLTFGTTIQFSGGAVPVTALEPLVVRSKRRSVAAPLSFSYR